MADIFARRHLSPAQARTVAQRRFEDAEWLRKSNDNARANGVFYLAGIVIECLLKAALLERHPDMQRAVAQDTLSSSGRRVWSLIYRLHGLDEMPAFLPDLQKRLAEKDAKERTNLLRTLKSICARWTIFARYSPKSEVMKNAADFLDQVRELKEWLK
jgi:hypothetical protein